MDGAIIRRRPSLTKLPSDGVSKGSPNPMYVKNTSLPMAMGMDSAMRIIMTEIKYGKMFFVMMRCVGVPNAREAKLYSRSRMIMTKLRMSRAMGSQPVMHMARMSVDTLGLSRSEEHTSELQSRGQLVCR